jgi:hypothetical protein
MTTPEPLFTSSTAAEHSTESRSTRRGAIQRGRRRRRSQFTVPPGSEGRAALIASLAQRSYPTYELFLYAVLCGALLGLGYFLD